MFILKCDLNITLKRILKACIYNLNCHLIYHSKAICSTILKLTVTCHIILNSHMTLHTYIMYLKKHMILTIIAAIIWTLGWVPNWSNSGCHHCDHTHPASGPSAPVLLPLLLWSMVSTIYNAWWIHQIIL